MQKKRDNYGVDPDAPAEPTKKGSHKRLGAIGHGLGGPIEDHLQQENKKQDDAINTIEEVLGDLKLAANVRYPILLPVIHGQCFHRNSR